MCEEERRERDRQRERDRERTHTIRICKFNTINTAGTKQSGVTLNDIILPPWAKGDPQEFIRVHREVCSD